MPKRTGYRNIHIHNASTGELLGGFYQRGSITETSLLDILKDVLLVVDGGFDISVRHRETGVALTPSSQPVALGNYDVYGQGSIKLTDESWIARPITYSLSGREDAFTNEVRQRDRKCVISDEVNEMAEYDTWDGGGGISKINSPRNGLLMSTSLHKRFVPCLFSINPDDKYKIITFGPNSWNIDGKILDPVCRDPSNPNHVPDQLLRWHFRQSVLANMRGAGEPLFESDFPPGSGSNEDHVS